MSLEELWQLFPIILTEHQDAWAAWYREEEYELAQILPAHHTVCISHVGSTAVTGIQAKPIRGYPGRNHAGIQHEKYRENLVWEWMALHEPE